MKAEFDVLCPEHGMEHFLELQCSHCESNNVNIVMLVGKCKECGYLETEHIKDYEEKDDKKS